LSGENQGSSVPLVEIERKMAVREEAGMWDLLKRQKDECKHLQDWLEDAAAEHSHAASVAELLEVLSLVQRVHFAGCQSCRDTAQVLLAAREIFNGVPSNREEARPWFAGRVMAAIAARERELALTVSPWSVVPRFASRLAWITAIVLLAGSTWLYEKPATAPTKQPSAASSQEYLFEAPAPPMNQDDVLISMAEKNQ
jgi:hypothetical protein